MNYENIDILIHRAQVIRSRNVNQAMSLLDDALALAQSVNYKAGMAKIIRDKASCHLQQKHYKRAITAYNEAILFFKDLKDIPEQLHCLSEISGIYYRLGDCPSALEFILQSLKLNTELGDSEGIANNFNEIGRLYIFLKEYDNAIDYFKKALKIFEGLHLRHEMVNSYYLLGNAYNWTDDHDKALYYLLRAVNSLGQLQDVDTKAKTLGSLAILYTKLKEWEKALSHFHSALDVAKEGASHTVIAQIKKSLGNLYIDLTQYDKAVEVLTKAISYAEQSPLESQLAKIHQFLSVAFEKMGDHKTALEHYKKYFELDKEISSEEVNLKTKALHIRYDLEEMKKQKEIAELSDKLKEQFLANVSHEIRTPMNGVLGMAHLLHKTNPNREQQEYIDAIKLSANNLMVIINDILDFSKINAGKIEFSENEFNLRDLIKGIIQILGVKAEEKKIQLGCTIDYNIKDNIAGDPIRLNQILTNLMSNAVKFTERGRVTLDVKLMELKESTCKIRFKVTDTGIGIPENKLQTIFDSFEQAENNKRRYEGTGLGLTIVKQLVELQGGTIQVRSKLNEGSEFIVEMNFRYAGKKAPLAPPQNEDIASNKAFAKINVLIVEDNKVNQLLIKNILRKFGFEEMDTVENGRSALEKLKAHRYDIVLMDIQMPDMDGYEITRELRGKLNSVNKAVPVLAITADASEKEKEKARQAGMNDYVVKPYTPEELYNAICRHIKTEKLPLPDRGQLLKQSTFDISAMNKFTGGDMDLTLQLIDIFLKQTPAAIEKMRELIPQKKWKEIHSIAHKTKSSVAIFELNELKRVITLIEEYTRDGVNLDEVPVLFDLFASGCKPILEHLREVASGKTDQTPT